MYRCTQMTKICSTHICVLAWIRAIGTYISFVYFYPVYIIHINFDGGMQSPTKAPQGCLVQADTKKEGTESSRGKHVGLVAGKLLLQGFTCIFFFMVRYLVGLISNVCRLVLFSLVMSPRSFFFSFLLRLFPWLLSSCVIVLFSVLIIWILLFDYTAELCLLLKPICRWCS